MAWYGAAKHRPMQTHNSKVWESAVGGTRHELRAIYGSTDNAMADHSNDALCKVVSDDTGHQLQLATADIRNDTDSFSETVPITPPSIEQILLWAKRAEKLGMSIEQYVTTLGVVVIVGTE